MTPVDVQITSPPDDSTFIRGQKILIEGVATWSGPTQMPIERMFLAAYESRFNGMGYTPWFHVNNLECQVQQDQTQDRTANWSNVVIPFDGLARYMLTAFAFDVTGTVIGSSRPLLLESSN